MTYGAPYLVKNCLGFVGGLFEGRRRALGLDLGFPSHDLFHPCSPPQHRPIYHEGDQMAMRANDLRPSLELKGEMLETILELGAQVATYGFMSQRSGPELIFCKCKSR